MKYITDFLAKERQKEYVVTKDFPNGTKFFIKGDPLKARIMHSCFKPLNDEQIDKLQADVGKAKKATYFFPEWYKDFFKTTNGLSIFFNSISFYGEQTPLVEHPIYGLTEALIERDNPEWMAPYNLRYVGNTIFDASVSRWLMIGSYNSDGTNIAWDFKTNKIVAMYALPVTLSIKALRKMKEAEHEQLIFAKWDGFDDFFLSETKRLGKVLENYSEVMKIKPGDITFWKKTLPVGHKDFIN